MNGIVYPRDETLDIYDDLKSSFTDKNFVKINTLKDNNCVYDSFLMAVHRNYQDKDTDTKRKIIRKEFIHQFKKYLTAESDATQGEIYSKIFEAFKLSEMNNEFEIRSKNNSPDIFDLVIIRKNKEKLSGYNLFSKNVKKNYSATSNLFDLISLDFMKEIIEQRIVKKIYCEKLKIDDGTNKEVSEIIDFINMKENSLDPVNFLKIITTNDCSNQDLVLKLFSEILEINIFLCRSWNTEFTIIKEYFKKSEDPYILIFKIEGRVSVTGINKNKIYETGGIKYSKGIKTLLNSEKDKNAINDLRKIYQNNIDSYYMEKYISYLKNIEQQSNLKNLEDFYESDTSEEEVSSEEEMMDEEEEEMIEEEILDEEEIKEILDEEEEMIELVGPVEIDTSVVPMFIKKYTREELIYLLNKCVNPQVNYSVLSKEELEKQYYKYIKNQDENVLSLEKKMESRFV